MTRPQLDLHETIEGSDWRGRLVASSRTGDDTAFLVELPAREPTDGDSSDRGATDGGYYLLPVSSIERAEDHLRCSYDRRTLEAFRLRGAVPEHLVLPVVREEVEVSKRVVQGETYVVRTETEVDEQPIDVALERETVDVERVEIDRFVDDAPAIREEDGLLVVPVVEEVLVVTKRLKLREEIHIRRRTTVERERSSVELRRQVAHVERRPASSDGETQP